MPRLLLALVVTLAVLVAPGPAVPAADAADIVGDDEQDRYVGTGGLVLPGSVDDGTRSEVAGCLGCAWRLSTPCLEPGLGVAFDGTVPCASVHRGCPASYQALRAWFRPEGGPWRAIGVVCIGPAGPVTVATLGRVVAQRLERAVPPLRPAYQPTAGVVTQAPVAFASGQPGSGLDERMTLAGQDVRLRARPGWEWSFGDGSSLATDRAGGRYPDLSVAHAYRRPGRYRVAVTCSWNASFTVAGLGPYPVPGAVNQYAEWSLPVGEGRAVLSVRESGAPPPR
ncbi:MAG: PKD domain-containing protein [Candidatus Nanopelagicales bacterium]